MKPTIKKLLCLAAAFLLIATTLVAQPILRLPAVIGNHMVLQEKTTVNIWGWADPGATVTVTPSWGEAVTVKATDDTKWCVELATPAASQIPQTIVVSSNKKVTKTIEDVLIGQVWLCSGQSNMNWSAAHGIVDMKQELESEMPAQIRLFTVTKNSASYPQEDCDGQWQVCTPKSALHFSGVGYFFGKRLHAELNQPVGLVNSSWGGTLIEVWTPASVMGKNREMVESWKQQTKSKGKWEIGSLYNAMINPLLKTTFAGAIWYQGESNKANANLYADEFRMLIDSWRKAFGSALPFYFVQIAPHSRSEVNTNGALLREKQAQVAATTPATGMVVISDLVDDVTDIHPRNKKGVGERLAGWALAEVYGKTGKKYKHATFKSVEFKRGQALITFDNAEGLHCKDEAIVGLEISDASLQFVPAQGMIDAKSGTLVVWNKQVARPTAVRYCYSDGAIGNLFDAAGLPAAPFRTDVDAATASTKAATETKPTTSAAKPSGSTAAPVSGITVTAEGEGFTVLQMAVGTKFFLNRVYPISAMPERFVGFSMLTHAAVKDQVQLCKVTAQQAGRVYIIARRNSITAVDLEGWKLERDSEIRYTTHDKEKPGILYVYYKEAKAGETITLPKTKDFAGISLMAAKIEYKK